MYYIVVGITIKLIRFLVANLLKLNGINNT